MGPPPKRRKHQNWSPAEEKELRLLFPEAFKTGAKKSDQCPREKVVLRAMAASCATQGAIFKAARTNWETIKKKVYRMVTSTSK